MNSVGNQNNVGVSRDLKYACLSRRSGIDGRVLPCAHIAAPILFETVKTRPMIGKLSRSAAANPNTASGDACHVVVNAKSDWRRRTRTSIIPFSLLCEGSNLQRSHLLRFEVLQRRKWVERT